MPTLAEVAASAAPRPVLTAGFDPSELRGPDGRWMHGGGAITTIVHRTSGGTIAAHQRPGGGVTLEDEHGHHATLDTAALKELRSESFRVSQMEPGDQGQAYHHEPLPDRRMYSRLRAGLRLATTGDEHPRVVKGLDDAYEHARLDLHLPSPASDGDPSYDELFAGPGTRMAQRELLRIADHALDSPAHRVDIGGGGHIDAFRDGRDRVIRTGASELRLTGGEMRKLEHAFASVGDLDGRDPELAGRMDVRTVKTKAGDITVTGEFSDHSVPTKIRFPSGEVITVPAEEPGWRLAYAFDNLAASGQTLLAGALAAAPRWWEALGAQHTYDALTAAIDSDEWGVHDACSLVACRAPLHPGPCRGWKHTLHLVSPGAFHALERQRVDRLNAKRMTKIQQLKAEGKRVPPALLKPILPKTHPGPAPAGFRPGDLAPGQPAHLAAEAAAIPSAKVGQKAKAASGGAHTVGATLAGEAAKAKAPEPGRVSHGVAEKSAAGPSIPAEAAARIASNPNRHSEEARIFAYQNLDKADFDKLPDAGRAAILRDLDSIRQDKGSLYTLRADTAHARLRAGSAPEPAAEKPAPRTLGEIAQAHKAGSAPPAKLETSTSPYVPPSRRPAADGAPTGERAIPAHYTPKQRDVALRVARVGNRPPSAADIDAISKLGTDGYSNLSDEDKAALHRVVGQGIASGQLGVKARAQGIQRSLDNMDRLSGRKTPALDAARELHAKAATGEVAAKAKGGVSSQHTPTTPEAPVSAPTKSLAEAARATAPQPGDRVKVVTKSGGWQGHTGTVIPSTGNGNKVHIELDKPPAWVTPEMLNANGKYVTTFQKGSLEKVALAAPPPVAPVPNHLRFEQGTPHSAQDLPASGAKVLINGRPATVVGRPERRHGQWMAKVEHAERQPGEGSHPHFVPVASMYRYTENTHESIAARQAAKAAQRVEGEAETARLREAAAAYVPPHVKDVQKALATGHYAGTATYTYGGLNVGSLRHLTDAERAKLSSEVARIAASPKIQPREAAMLDVTRKALTEMGVPAPIQVKSTEPVAIPSGTPRATLADVAKAAPREAGKAKRGDLVAVEETSRIATRDGRGANSTRVRLARVTSVTRDGQVKEYQIAGWEHPTKVQHDLPGTKYHVLHQEKIDTEAALRTAAENPWHNDRAGKPYDSLAQLREAIRPHLRTDAGAPAGGTDQDAPRATLAEAAARDTLRRAVEADTDDAASRHLDQLRGAQLDAAVKAIPASYTSGLAKSATAGQKRTALRNWARSTEVINSEAIRSGVAGRQPGHMDKVRAEEKARRLAELDAKAKAAG